ncbi:response regulator [Cellulomonas xylanilytica]|uniref:DNA-binding response regulator n=1 Tax=Cellulomonas xylanilytica TaxID=233583 RepID=A0A510V9C5_9CELL|nr:response regulator transcription factor [Cellulomonas xylanilytica]GEK23473.1 DNA-binding response regulator [Cellulomonas xylanilytica]
MTRVVVADDQPVVLQGFAAIIGAAPDLDVVGAAKDGRDLLRLVATAQPDVAVVDVRMPVLDGIAATARISAEHPSTRVLILTTFDLDEYVYDALRAGASGFLLKDVTADRLVEAVRMVAEGSMLLGPTVTRRLVDDFTTRSPAPTRTKGIDDLTPRELEILRAVARGLSNAEIGAELWIAEPTVKSHVSEALRKLGCRDRVQLVIAAYESGLVGS